MAGLCRLDRDFGGFQVADLTHHDDVRVLTQEGAQRLGKIETLLGVHVDLVDAFQVDFDRVLGGGDVALHGIEDVQAGIQRYGFARAGRAGNQNHALRPGKGRHIHLLLIVFITQRVDTHLGAFGVENTQHHFLAP